MNFYAQTLRVYGHTEIGLVLWQSANGTRCAVFVSYLQMQIEVLFETYWS